jgi:hypothetical protein
MDVPLNVQTERSHTECPPPVLFSLTVGGALNKAARIKIRHYRQIYADRPDPIVSEESEQFRFLRASRLANLKGSLGFILAKASAMRVTIPIDLSTRPFIPLPRFFNSHRVPPLLNQSLVLIPQQSA